MNYRTPQTLEEFQTLVATVMTEEGISLTFAVYRLMDFLFTRAMSAPNPPIACTSGCSACCYQPVSLGKLEWAEIENFLSQHPELFSQIQAKLHESVTDWQEFKQKPLSLAHPIMIAASYGGVPCMFLDETTGNCQIYPVRPLACRVTTSGKRCESWHYAGADTCRFIWDEMAFLTVGQAQWKGLSAAEEVLQLQEWLQRSGLTD